MMKSSKNSIVLILLVSSVLLLLALQVLWLKNSYEKAYLDLRKQTSELFRSTIFSLRDSMLLKNIEHIPVDSGVFGNRLIFTTRVDSIVAQQPKKENVSSSQVQIYVASGKGVDSIKKMVQPLASKFQEGKLPGGASFIVRMGVDSLSVDSIEHYYKKNLAEVPVTVSFKVIHHAGLRADLTMNRENIFPPPLEEMDRPPKREYIFSNKMNSDWVRLDPVHRYYVQLADFRSILLKQITPEILFSIFLTMLTIAAFATMYRSIRSQQKLMDLKNDFISNITHELKTPITTVGVAIEAIKDFKAINNPTLTNEYLNIAQNELSRLSILTDKILKTAIFENKGIEFRPEPIQLDRLIEQVLTSMKLILEKQEAKITFTKQGEDFLIIGGSVPLTSIIYNLLDNALKYSLVNPEISISLKADVAQVTLSVKDNGIGIPLQYRKKVFEKFFRVPTGDVHNIKGYGLGLSYVDSVVKSHKGTIDVQSEPGKGSLFIITLPKQPRKTGDTWHLIVNAY